MPGKDDRRDDFGWDLTRERLPARRPRCREGLRGSDLSPSRPVRISPEGQRGSLPSRDQLLERGVVPYRIEVGVVGGERAGPIRTLDREPEVLYRVGRSSGKALTARHVQEALEKEQEWDVSSEPHPEARAVTSIQRRGGGFVIPEIKPAVSEIPEAQLNEIVRALERRYFGSWTIEPGPVCMLAWTNISAAPRNVSRPSEPKRWQRRRRSFRTGFCLLCQRGAIGWLRDGRSTGAGRRRWRRWCRPAPAYRLHLERFP